MARTKPTIPVATISDGASSTMSDLLGTGSRGLGGLLSTFEFTDAQWSKLTRWSAKLPQAARGEFKNCVDTYLTDKVFVGFERNKEYYERNAGLRAKILSLLDDSEWRPAIASLDSLQMQGEWHLSGRRGPMPRFGRMLDSLLRLLAEKLEYQNSQASKSRLPSGPKSSRASYKFIADAAAQWEKFTGRQASRGPKKGADFQGFIKDLCEIADPAIGPGTIHEALRRYINGRRPPKGLRKRVPKRRGEVRSPSA